MHLLVSEPSVFFPSLFLQPQGGQCSTLNYDSIQTSAFSIVECFPDGSKEKGVALIMVSLVMSLNTALVYLPHKNKIVCRKDKLDAVKGHLHNSFIHTLCSKQTMHIVYNLSTVSLNFKSVIFTKGYNEF